MKVTTDGCLFGAYVASQIKNHKSKIKNCLDIGTGTGLLSLMLAQKNNISIDAVEIDTPSYYQAKENFKRSLWNEQLNIFNADITDLDPSKKYDCIISNPPFFEDDLMSANQTKNKAKHAITLTLQQLLIAIDTHLNAVGFFFVLLPYHRTDYFIKEAAAIKFYPSEKLVVKQTPKHIFFRSILIFSREENDYKTSTLIIKESNNQYTPEFIYLLKDYYLNTKAKLIADD